ncbi:Cof-type HAD-IIB family hydrolase [Niallia taxi]|uniref:HAD family phosphatase n=1 Tax=Niallia taxi TaxID=2499688 RepID=A0A437KAW4_9BACI|nr:Cof-type HAD-IIB family hydrolase [Niallia taxi]MED4036185.1 Cof-type HAD-IIB family hydrolase [Niallia taxi]RVT62503.1 HAD family phosphatase [Niallia taxi]
MKLIALDLDGTTLNSKKVITTETIQAIRKAQKQGHIVMALTGRSATPVIAELAKYDLDLHVGGNNGTEIYANGQLIELTSLPLLQCQKIVLELEKEVMPYKICTNISTFAHKDWLDRFEKVVASGLVPSDYYDHKDYKMFTTPPHVYGQPFFNQPEELLNIESSVIKFLILGLDPIQKNRVKALLETIEDTYVTSSSPFNLEVTHVNGHKGNGLKAMARFFNIPIEDTVAIGDEINDIPMFHAAGLSIAMGNAEEEVKKHSDVVTLSNDENGVAYAFEKYILTD